MLRVNVHKTEYRTFISSLSLFLSLTKIAEFESSNQYWSIRVLSHLIASAIHVKTSESLLLDSITVESRSQDIKHPILNDLHAYLYLLKWLPFSCCLLIHGPLLLHLGSQLMQRWNSPLAMLDCSNCHYLFILKFWSPYRRIAKFTPHLEAPSFAFHWTIASYCNHKTLVPSTQYEHFIYIYIYIYIYI